MGVIILLLAAGIVAIGAGFVGYGVSDQSHVRRACTLVGVLFFFVAAYLFGWITGSSLYLWILLG